MSSTRLAEWVQHFDQIIEIPSATALTKETKFMYFTPSRWWKFKLTISWWIPKPSFFTNLHTGMHLYGIFCMSSSFILPPVCLATELVHCARVYNSVADSVLASILERLASVGQRDKVLEEQVCMQEAVNSSSWRSTCSWATNPCWWPLPTGPGPPHSRNPI